MGWQVSHQRIESYADTVFGGFDDKHFYITDSKDLRRAISEIVSTALGKLGEGRGQHRDGRCSDYTAARRIAAVINGTSRLGKTSLTCIGSSYRAFCVDPFPIVRSVAQLKRRNATLPTEDHDT